MSSPNKSNLANLKTTFIVILLAVPVLCFIGLIIYRQDDIVTYIGRYSTANNPAIHRQGTACNISNCTIHIAAVICRNRLEDGFVMLKSAVIFSHSCLVLHVFTEEKLKKAVQIKELLTDVDSVIYLDADAIFLSPVEEAWKQFDTFGPRHSFGIAPNLEIWYSNQSLPYCPPGLSSGVLFMNLTRMRESTWFASIQEYFQKYRKKLYLFDQDLINIYCFFNQDAVYMMDCVWNYRGRFCDPDTRCDAVLNTTGIKVLHGYGGIYRNIRQWPHIVQVYKAFREERGIYNECIKKSVETNSLSVEERYVHYTFDFSQCVSLPHYARQMGPLYFLSLRKVQIFGFRIDGVPQQLNFIVNEGETMGGEAGDTHGPNSVISMVDWALENRGQGVLSCTIHADNCPGQNKNKYVLGYFAWRVMTGQHSNIEYLMQIPGHARCLVDGGFAHIKKLYRRYDCETMDQIETLVNKSSSTNIAIRYPVWQWRDWKAFLSRYFKPLVGIRKFQYFRFSADEPGVVTVKENYEGQEKKICLLKDPAFRFENIERPYRVGCQGLTVERQRYLQRFVRPYVRPTNQNDFCSEPAAH